MYRFQTCPVEGEATRGVYRHPNFSDYGLALNVDRTGEQDSITCHIVTGVIDGQSKLEILTDHSVPLDVQIWAFAAMNRIRNSVNTDSSLNLDALFPNNGGILYYTVNQESTS